MSILRIIITAFTMLTTPVWGQTEAAQSGPFSPGWQLDPSGSLLSFQSIKNQSKVEQSSFAKMTGKIDPDGKAEIRIALDSVNTKVDLRNVRMRFMLFETFNHPEAVITIQLDPALIADLKKTRLSQVTLPYTIDLHGITKTLSANMTVVMIDDEHVIVSTHEPILLSLADFDLTDGLQKLEEAAGVKILPSTTIIFEMVFRKVPNDSQLILSSAKLPDAAALEPEGNFDVAACIGRFEILSRADHIEFATASVLLTPDHVPLLRTVSDIVNRCPGVMVQVEGHTDNVGSWAVNQRLSELRAASVVDYLSSLGVPSNRMRSIGLGETQPIATNTTNEGRHRNRRIEFSAIIR